MGDAYLGAAAERITFTGLLYSTAGRICGEIPDFPGVVAYGLSEGEVKSTLQGLLEEHIEAMLDDEEPLPEPEFESTDDIYLSADASKPHLVNFTVVLPSTVSKSLLATGGDLSPFFKTPKLKELEYNAVILRTVSNYGGHFPDLPGAFTSGRTVEEVQAKLQELLEFYVGGLVKNGMYVPEPRFKQLGQLDMSEQELKESPLVCMTSCIVALPV